MSHLSRLDAPAAGWPGLAAELDLWREAGRVAVLWWRDDDAIMATAELDLLLRLAGEVPLALAVIPALARSELAEALAAAPAVAVLQHGWQHVNRAAAGKKSEYPVGRGAAAVAAELGAGRARLAALFGARARPVFVPPWNRFDAEFLPLLRQSGMTAWSAMARPDDPALPPGLGRIDVHVDLVAWHGDRGFIGTATALATLTGHLRTRRQNPHGEARPLGILTHHRIIDRATVDFLDRLVAVTQDHPAARWAGIEEYLA